MMVCMFKDVVTTSRADKNQQAMRVLIARVWEGIYAFAICSMYVVNILFKNVHSILVITM